MDLSDFLNQLVAGDFAHVAPVAVVVGALVWGIIELIQKLVTKDGQGKQLSPDLQFWLALILSFVVPIGAYLAQQFMAGSKPTLNGLFLAAAVGYAVSQGIHWLASGSANAHAAIAAGVNTDPPKPANPPTAQ